jgi:hypothetical protein
LAQSSTRAERKARLDKRAPMHRSCELRHYDPPRSLSAYCGVLFFVLFVRVWSNDIFRNTIIRAA